jgi:hypothetical protein
MITKYNNLFARLLVSVLVVVTENSLANVHDVLDLGLQLTSLKDGDGMVQGDIASNLVGIVKVNERSRNVFLALLDVADLP